MLHADFSSSVDESFVGKSSQVQCSPSTIHSFHAHHDGRSPEVRARGNQRFCLIRILSFWISFDDTSTTIDVVEDYKKLFIVVVDVVVVECR